MANPNRNFTAVFNTNHAAPSFIYLWDPAALVTGGINVPITGAMRVAQPSDFAANVSLTGVSISVGAVAVTGTANVSITNVLPIPVSGVMVVNSLPTQAIAVTGTPNANISNGVLPVSGNVTVLGGGALNVAVTGGVLSTSSAATAITGNPQVTISNPISVTGLTISTTVNTVAVTGSPVVTINNPIAVTGLTVSTTVNTVSVTGTPAFSVSNGVVPVSGVVTATLSATTVAITGSPTVTMVNPIAVTGNALLALLSISGSLASNLTDPAWVTGQVSILSPIAVTGNPQVSVSNGVVPISGNVTVINTATVTIGNPIAITGNHQVTLNATAITGTATVSISNGVVPISGVVTAGVSNPIGVTGYAVDKMLPVINGFTTQFVPIGGRVVTPSGNGSVTGYNATGDMAMLNINQQNGGLFVNQAILDKTQDEVTVWPTSTGIASTSAVSGIGNAGWGAPLGNNPNRRAWFFQNMSTGVMFLKFGAGANTGSCNVVLKGGTAQNDGLGATYSDAPAIYTGPVFVTGYFLTGSPAYVCWEL